MVTASGEVWRKEVQKAIRVTSKGKTDAEEVLNLRLSPRGIPIERQRLEEAWIKEMAYYSGLHHFFFEEGVVWDIKNDPEYAHQVLYKTNLSALAIVRAAAKIHGVNANFRVAPQSGSIRHRQVAEMSERVFRHQREVTGFDEKKLLQTMWAAICGSGFLHVRWNAAGGTPERFYLRDKETRVRVPAALFTDDELRDRERDLLFEDIYTGEVDIEVRSPFTVYHDWSSRDASVLGCHWMADKFFVDKLKVAEEFGIDPDDLLSDDESSGLLNYEEVVAFMSPGSAIGPLDYFRPRDKVGTRCLWIDMRERASRRYPRGRRVVYAGGLILEDGPNPYIGCRSRHAHLPWIKQDWSPHPGRFHGRSLMEDMTSPQHFTNESTSKLIEFMRVFGAPPTFVRKGCGIDDVTTRPGAIYYVDQPQFDFKAGAPVQMPPEVQGVRAICQQDLMMIASQSELDGSKLPSQLRSGEAIRLMMQERSIALNVPAMQSVRAVRDVGRALLSIGQVYYRDPRLMRYLGEDDEWTVQSFVGADLHHDLVVVGEVDIGDTVAMAKAEINDAVASGALNPRESDEDRILLLKALRLGSSDEVLQAKLAAERNQEREIQEMIADPLRYGDQGYPVMEWEDHQTEMRVLVRFMYRPEFGDLPDRAKAVIVDHWQKHKTLQDQAVAAMLQMQAELKGTPGQKGQASQARK